MESSPRHPPLDADEVIARLDDIWHESPNRLRPKVERFADDVRAWGLAESVASGVGGPASNAGSMIPPPAPSDAAHAATDWEPDAKS